MHIRIGFEYYGSWIFLTTIIDTYLRYSNRGMSDIENRIYKSKHNIFERIYRWKANFPPIKWIYSQRYILSGSIYFDRIIGSYRCIGENIDIVSTWREKIFFCDSNISKPICHFIIELTSIIFSKNLNKSIGIVFIFVRENIFFKKMFPESLWDKYHHGIVFWERWCIVNAIFPRIFWICRNIFSYKERLYVYVGIFCKFYIWFSDSSPIDSRCVCMLDAEKK